MLYAILWTLALCLSGTARAADPLATVGEVIGGVEVLALVDHSEFHQIQVRLQDGRVLTIEVVKTDTPLGACTHHGFAIQPRWELLGDHDQQIEDQPPVVVALCARLQARPPALALVPLPSAADGVDAASRPAPVRAVTLVSGGPQPPRPRPLHAVLLVLAASLAAGLALARSPGPFRLPSWALEVGLVGLLGAVLRVWLGLWAPLWAPLFGFGRFASVLADVDSVSRYGDGYVATMTVFTAVFGSSTATILWANLFLGVLVPPLVWGLVRLVAPDRPWAPLASGLLAALLPVYVWLSATEVMHVSLVTYEVLAVFCAALFVRHAPARGLGALGFALASGCAAVMALHTRPEAIPFAAALGVYVLLHARRPHVAGVACAAAVMAVGLAFRFSEMAFDISDEASALNYGLLLETERWLGLVWPDLSSYDGGSFTTVLNRPALTSPLLPLLALVGLLTAPRRTAAWLSVWWLLSIVPVIPKGWPLADAYRLQAPSLLPVLVLAGIGASALLRRAGARRPVLVLLGLGLAVSPQLLVERPAWGTLDEARLLMRATPALPGTATVLYDDHHQHSQSIPQWGALAAPGTRWVGIRDGLDGFEPTSPLMAWLGTSCTERGDGGGTAAEPSAPCARLRAACSLRPATVETVPLTGDIDRTFSGASAEVGYYTLEDCRF